MNCCHTDNNALDVCGDGCPTIILRDGELIPSPDWSIDEHSPELAAQIRAHGMEEGDVVLIGGSNTGIKHRLFLFQKLNSAINVTT